MKLAYQVNVLSPCEVVLSDSKRVDASTLQKSGSERTLYLGKYITYKLQDKKESSRKNQKKFDPLPPGGELLGWVYENQSRSTAIGVAPVVLQSSSKVRIFQVWAANH